MRNLMLSEVHAPRSVYAAIVLAVACIAIAFGACSTASADTATTAPCFAQNALAADPAEPTLIDGVYGVPAIAVTTPHPRYTWDNPACATALGVQLCIPGYADTTPELPTSDDDLTVLPIEDTTLAAAK